MTARNEVRLRRIYDEKSQDDGARVLVDRLWPRGMSKSHAALDEWCKDVAPSAALRKWYGHDPERFEQFADRYRTELEGGEAAEALKHLRSLAAGKNLTILTATKDASIGEAAVLVDLLSS